MTAMRQHLDPIAAPATRRDLGVLIDDDGVVLFAAAEVITAEQLAMMIRYSSGLVHAAMRGGWLDQLRIPDQPVFANEDSGLRFTVAVDAATVGTGISAIDRALTLRTLADPSSTPDDFRRPGHVLPVRCGGQTLTVFDRALAIVARSGHAPVAVVARLMHDDGPELTAEDARWFAEQHRLIVHG